MASALLRRLRKRPDESPVANAASPTPGAAPMKPLPSPTARELDHDEDVLGGAPPRSYAQLVDAAKELVAASWDPSLPVRYWLNAARELQLE